MQREQDGGIFIFWSIFTFSQRSTGSPSDYQFKSLYSFTAYSYGGNKI